MTLPKKIKTFFSSEDFFQTINKLEEFLGINPNQDYEKDLKITIFVDNYFRYRLNENDLINFINKNFDWLSDEEINKFLNFIKENFYEKREKLWQEEKEETKLEEIFTESFDEREKRYLELMKNIIKTPQEIKEKNKLTNNQENKNIPSLLAQKTEEKLNEKITTQPNQKITSPINPPQPQTTPQSSKINTSKIINFENKIEKQIQKDDNTIIINWNEEEKRPELPKETIIIKSKKISESKRDKNEEDDNVIDLSKM